MLWVEECSSGVCYARQTGSYPLMVALPCNGLHEGQYLEKVVVTGVHSSRSVEGLPLPLGASSRVKVKERLQQLGLGDHVRSDPFTPRC